MLTVRECAEEMKVSTKRVRTWIHTRRLPACKPGGQRGNYRIDEAAWERFKRQNTTTHADGGNIA